MQPVGSSRCPAGAAVADVFSSRFGHGRLPGPSPNQRAMRSPMSDLKVERFAAFGESANRARTATTPRRCAGVVPIGSPRALRQ